VDFIFGAPRSNLSGGDRFFMREDHESHINVPALSALLVLATFGIAAWVGGYLLMRAWYSAWIRWKTLFGDCESYLRAQSTHLR